MQNESEIYSTRTIPSPPGFIPLHIYKKQADVLKETEQVEKEQTQLGF